MHMNDTQSATMFKNVTQNRNKKRASHTSRFTLLAILICGILGLLCSACTSDQTTARPTTTVTPQSNVAAGSSPQQAASSPASLSTPPLASSTPNTISIPIKVYFSKNNQNDNPSVVAVARTSPTEAVGTYAIEQLITGPTATEKSDGYYSQLQESLIGTSNCSGQDFQLVLNTKGQVPEQGTATITFCRELQSAGIGTDASISDEVRTTLEQFSSIKKVVILTEGGHCFGDESGRDLCLQ